MVTLLTNTGAFYKPKLIIRWCFVTVLMQSDDLYQRVFGE